MVPFDSWRLVFTLQGANISAGGLKGILLAGTRPDTAAGDGRAGREISRLDEVEGLLAAGSTYELQLEPGSPHAAAPLVHARLLRCERSSEGLELAFAFEKHTARDVWGLVSELAASEGQA